MGIPWRDKYFDLAKKIFPVFETDSFKAVPGGTSAEEAWLRSYAGDAPNNIPALYLPLRAVWKSSSMKSEASNSAMKRL